MPDVPINVLCRNTLFAARLRYTPSSEQNAIRLSLITPSACSYPDCPKSRRVCHPVPPPPNDRPIVSPRPPRNRHSHSTTLRVNTVPRASPFAKAPYDTVSP